MLREKKAQVIGNLENDISRSTIVIATSYQGLTAQGMAELRASLAEADVECHVVKNNLLRFAARRLGKEQLMDMVEGPTALAFGYDDVVRAAKALSQYMKSKDTNVVVKGGLLGGRVLSVDQVLAIASLPPRETIYAQLVGQLQAPIRRLHGALNWPLQGLHNVLRARLQTMSE